MNNFSHLPARILAGEPVTRNEALTTLTANDAETFSLIDAASTLRRHYFANTVKVNYLVNLKSGLCPETPPHSPAPQRGPFLLPPQANAQEICRNITYHGEGASLTGIPSTPTAQYRANNRKREEWTPKNSHPPTTPPWA